MQKRHLDRRQYFSELAKTCRRYYIPYIQKVRKISSETKILEIGCGEGGNLLPFAELGCPTIGIDLSLTQIDRAKLFFKENGHNHPDGFISANFLDLDVPNSYSEKFDVILLHDVIEHIEEPLKNEFISKLSMWLREDGLLFVGFPAWQMPFGGHQQICRHKIPASIPYVHLLPKNLYSKYLEFFGETEECINELLSIKRSKMSIEHFESIIRLNGFDVIDRTLWFINPHYETKFGLKPVKLPPLISHAIGLRNFFSTSCFYLLRKRS